MIEHDWRRQAEEQTLVGDELIGWHVYLDVPAEIVHSLREWLDHRDRRDRPTAILKRIPRTPASTRRLSSAFVTVVSSTAITAGVCTEPTKRVEHAVIGPICGRCDHHRPRRAKPRLQRPIIVHRRIGRPERRVGGRRKPIVVDVHVTVARRIGHGLTRRFTSLGKCNPFPAAGSTIRRSCWEHKSTGGGDEATSVHGQVGSKRYRACGLSTRIR